MMTRSHRGRALGLAVLGLVPGSSGLPDLDVGVPPGSPISWGERFPAITPRGMPLFPTASPGQPDPSRTVAVMRGTSASQRVSSSFGMLRIITWDIVSEIHWVSKTPPPATVTGSSRTEAALPQPDESLYWVAMAPLLRLLLHPQLVSETELIAHLVEIGEPAGPVVENGRVEPVLAKACQQVAEMIAPHRAGMVVRAGKTPEETMLRRFLRDELVREFPYDPNGSFGGRFLLFGDELEPLLVEFANHRDSRLRRNAVAALARIGSRTALRVLSSLAANTGDPVVLMRALGAMSRHRFMPDPELLIQRAAKATRPAEKIAIVVALGRCERTEAIPFLTGLAGDRDHNDLRLAALCALSRIRTDPKDDKVGRAAMQVCEAARRSPGAFAITHRKDSPKADFPDPPTTRARIFEQMGLILRTRSGYRKGPADKLLLDLSRPSRAGRDVPRGRVAGYPNTELGQVLPPVQTRYIEILGGLGEKGLAILRGIAESDRVEPFLRRHALLHMPLSACQEIAMGMVTDRGAKPDARAFALDALLRRGTGEILGICRDLLREAAERSPEKATAEERHMWREALLLLGRSNALDPRTLRGLLPYVAAGRAGGGKDAVDRMKALVDQLVDGTLAGQPERWRRELIKAILDLATREKLGAYHTPERRATSEKFLEGQLQGLLRKDRDRRLDGAIRMSLLNFLLGSSVQQKLIPRPVIPFEEEVLFALGRERTRGGAEELTKFLAGNPHPGLRAAACLALGMTGDLAVASSLTRSLIHEDGFVRYCAYRSLRQLTGQDFWADWLYGESKDWVEAAQHYLRWLGRRPPR